MRFCATCNELIGAPHRRHTMLFYDQMSEAQKRIAANQLGTKLARLVKLNPMLIVIAFLSALEDANQHDFSRMVEKQWAALLKH